MTTASRVRDTWKALRRCERGVWVGDGRVHLEVCAAPAERRGAFEAELVEMLGAVPGVRWAALARPLRRVVVAVDGGAPPSRDDLCGVIAAVEARHGAQPAFDPDDGLLVPGDPQPLHRVRLELGLDAAALAVGAASRGAETHPAELDLAALLAALEGIPAARAWLDRRAGPADGDLWLNAGNALAAALLHGVGPVVDGVRRWIRLSSLEALADRWPAREAALFADPGRLAGAEGAGGPAGATDPRAEDGAAPADGARDAARPVPLPDGAIERYASTAGVASLGALGLGVAATQRPELAGATLVGGTARPAYHGREAFTWTLVGRLARRGALVLRPDRLAHLDRVDTVVFDARVLGDGAPGADARATIDAVRRVGLSARVVAAEGDGAGVPGAARLDAPAGAAAAIRGLQRAGHVVAWVGAGPDPALRTADLSLGLPTEGGPLPLAADVVGARGLEDARLLAGAAEAARRVAADGVRVAAAEGAAGLLLALGGLEKGTAARVALASQAASLLAVLVGARAAQGLRAGRHAAAPEPPAWHALDPDEALRRLGSRRDGLGAAEVALRTPRAEPPRSRGAVYRELVLDEVSNPLAPILGAGAGLSALAGAWADALLILGVLGANALLGAGQRLRTEARLRALDTRERRHARVRRGGAVAKVEAEGLVPGDVVTLQAGEVVLADCRLLDAHGLEVDESSLTGESEPVRKRVAPVDAAAPVAERRSMLYEGTSLTAGEAHAVVVATGDATEARRAHLEAEDAAPAGGVEQRLEALTELTAPAAAVAGLVLVAAGVARGARPADVLASGVGLAVAAIPEGLPVLATAAQLAAAERLSERGAIARNPRAIEALGRVDVLCADKTGTLTEGRLRLRRVWAAASTDEDGDGAGRPVDALDEAARGVLAVALRASPEGVEGRRLPHPTDRAVVRAAADAGVTTATGATGWRRRHERPFEPGSRAWHGVLGAAGDGARVSVKGAPEAVLPRCDLAPGERARLEARAHGMARRGLRVLAVAERPLPGDPAKLAEDDVRGLTFLGLLGVADPVRATARQAVDALRRAGVAVVMVTGDHPSTAEAIAAELGLVDGRGAVLTGVEVDALGDPALDARVGDVAIFARVTPRQKVRIVRALRRAGRVVAMTGDGANDAPAIRLADVGIALGEKATAAARTAADVVVPDGRIESLVDAILEGRALWASVRDAVSLLVGGNLGEIGFTLLSGLVGGRAGLNARQLLLINALTDAAPALAVALRPPDRDVAPETWLEAGPERSLGAALDEDIVFRALITGGATTAAWLAARATGARGDRASTVALVTLVGSQLAQTLAVGGRSLAVRSSGLASIALLLAAVETPGVSGFFGCRPLGPVSLAQAGAASAAAALVTRRGGALRRRVPGLVAALRRWSARVAGEDGDAPRAAATPDPAGWADPGTSVEARA